MVDKLSGPYVSRLASSSSSAKNQNASPSAEQSMRRRVSRRKAATPCSIALLSAVFCLLLFCGPLQILQAQTLYFSGATSTLPANGLNAPYGIAIDSAGNVFVADSANNQVKEILAAGGYTTVNIIGSGFLNPQGVAVDQSGNVFVADTSNNAIKEILAGSGNTVTIATGLSNPYGLAVDAADNVFVADTYSSPSGTGSVKEFLAPGYTTVNTLGSGFTYPTGVAVDASGNVFVADYGNGAIKEIVAASGYTTVLTFVTGYGGPSGIAVDGSGNIFFADTYPGHIDELVAASGYVTVEALGSGMHGPTGVAVDPRGNLFVADQGNNAVKEVMTQGVNLGAASIGTATPLTAALSFTFLNPGTINSPIVTTQGDSGQDFVDTGSGDTCVAGSFNQSETCIVNVSFAPTASGARYGAVTLSGSSGTVGTTVYVYGTGLGPQLTFSPATSSDVSGAVANPSGIAVDANANIFVADTGNNAVKEFLANGAYASVLQLGSGFSGPGSVAIDGAGNIFVADTGNNSVKEISAVGGYATVTTLGGLFSGPQGVAVDSFGNVFVADSGNNAVKEILASGGYVTTTTLGSGFANPTGVAVDASGNVFVADSGNNAVKEIAAAGGYTTVTTIGTGFAAPNSVSLDGGANVFVADSGNNQIKEILATGGYATVITLSGTFTNPLGAAVDGTGNVFVANAGSNEISKLDFVDPPTLNFVSTPAGTTSSDSPQTVTLNNIGNGTLTFPPPTAGLNPSISTGFTLDPNSTCPQVSSSSAAGTLAAGASCTDSISFTPVVEGTITGSLVTQDDNLNAASPGYTTQTILLNGTASATSPTILFSVPDHVYGDAPFTVTATSNSTGAFTYTVVSGPATITGNTVTISAPGTVVLRASEAADANYSAGFKDASFNVAPATPAIVFSVPDHNYGDAPFTVTATSNSTGAFTYSVISGPATISGSTVTLTGAGTVVLRASEIADANYAAGSKDATFNVTDVTPTIVFSVPNHIYGDAPFTVAASSNSTGAFTYSVVSGPAAVTGNTVTITGTGTVVLRASEAADANYPAATRDATFSVAPAAPAIVFNVPNHTAGDAPFIVSATSNSTGAFTYSVISGPAVIAGSTVTLTGAGTVVLRASEAADANYTAGSRDATFTVSGLAPTIVFTVPNHRYSDVPFVVSATSNSPGAFTYSVVSGPATISGATVTLTGAGQVVLQVIQAASGSYSAASADTTFAVSGSITLSVTPDTATVNPGAVATYTLTVTPAGSATFADPINFAAFGLPDGYSYAFSPATLPAGSAATPVKLTIQTTTAAANENRQFPGVPFAPLTLAFLMLPLFGIKSSRTFLRKMSSRPTALLILLLSLGALLGLSGCGSGVFKTPHKYDIAIIATDSTTTATTTTEVSLIVQ